MIIPTADFDPLFAEDGIPFGTKMIQYIQREFADLLGKQAGLLDHPAGLEILAELRGLRSKTGEQSRKAA